MSVETLTDANWQEKLDTNERVIIKFYADWCGSCRLIAPKYKKQSDNENFKDILFAEVDAEVNPEIRKWAKVTGLPFFATIHNGKMIVGDNFAREERLVEIITELQAYAN
jgi:thiol-disulfide isomerase/thioredoxin